VQPDHKMLLSTSRKVLRAARLPANRRRIVKPATAIDQLDAHILSTAHQLVPRKPTSLHHIVQQYYNRAGLVLDQVLPYDAYPDKARRADAVDGVVMIAHIALAADGTIGKLVVCSGFAVHTEGERAGDVIISCGHTLDEVSHSLPSAVR
jgi:hypothetical protein